MASDYLAQTNALREQANPAPTPAPSGIEIVPVSAAVVTAAVEPVSSRFRYDANGLLLPFDSGVYPSRIDPRDRYLSGILQTLPPGEAGAPPPIAASAAPIGPQVMQKGGRCVAYGFLRSLQRAVYSLTGKWYWFDADQFFAAGGGNDTYGWEIGQALAWAKNNGIFVAEYGSDYLFTDTTRLLKITEYWKVPNTEPDIAVAIYQAHRHPGWSTLLWETAWPNDWYNPAKGTGLLKPGARDVTYGHLTSLWRYLPRVYGAQGTCATGENTWSDAQQPWGVNGNYEVQLSDVLSPDLLWGLWQFRVDPAALAAAGL